MPLNDDEDPDFLEFFPPMFTCISELIRELVEAGLQIYAHDQKDSATYALHIRMVWYWRFTTLGIASEIGYPRMHTAVLAALMYLFASSHSLDNLHQTSPKRN